MIRLRTIQSARNRIAATDERSDQVRPGELEVPKIARCPICHGPTSSLTGGACLDCRRKMDAAMDEQMKQLAEDREFQRELEEAAEDLPLNMKRCPSCGAEHSRPFTDLCGAVDCDVWAMGKYDREYTNKLIAMGVYD